MNRSINNKITKYIENIVLHETGKDFCANFENLYFIKFSKLRKKIKGKNAVLNTKLGRDKLFTEFYVTTLLLIEKNIKLVNSSDRGSNNFLQTLKTKFDFIKLINQKLLDGIIDDDTHQEEQTYNSRIFTSEKSFNLFEELISETDDLKYLSDISFIIRKMMSDKLIYDDVKHRVFFELLSNNYDKSITKIKTLNQVNSKKRLSIYSLKKQPFKL